MRDDYVHGYSERERQRLGDQAASLAEILHHDTGFGAGERVLEAGCGVGSQTVTLAAASPETQFTSIDISEPSLAAARTAVAERGLTNVTFAHADIFDLPYADDSFDHVFICFVLEHMSDPAGTLAALLRVLRPGGSLTVIEGDHGSTFFSPDSDAARDAVRCLIEAQAAVGGDSLIGRRLYPVLCSAGLTDVLVSPRFVYVDNSRPQLEDGFTRNTFAAMVEGVRDQALSLGLIEPERFDQGVADLYAATGPEGTFCYTFFKGVGVKG
ncbi:MAG: methyltransferase domain-containing protein [Rhodospirillaceae bacterium]|jgi:predicted O-methyltransferase YrrM|nr:methyltransferase domain-containing protein [Rhodospirillaceae bacterium]MBT6136617.1 methyltransferase domain-containing protein [Rhodospirillaceae bacterium]